LRDDKERLCDISEAIEKIEKYASFGYQAFSEDERTQVWIIHHLQMIGETANRQEAAIARYLAKINHWPPSI
jgi:uncharacterized protein with HEPN domain